MTATTHLALPLIAPAQAQKHITHNEALALIDALVQLSVLDRDLTAPPASPANGDRYIVGPSPSGAWTGHAGAIAWFDVDVWRFLTPIAGWIAWIADEALPVVWTGSAWAPLTALNPTAMIGVNATADAANRLAVSSAGSLFNHAGAGHQMKINKAAMSDTASLLMQTGFVGRAEIGTAGDDHLHVKMRGDDTVWREAIIVDRAGGTVAFPATPFGENLLINGDFSINQRSFAGGALTAGQYGFDRWKAGAAGATLSVSGDIVTLSAGAITQTVEAGAGPWGAMSLSVENLSGGALDVTVNGATQTLAPGAGRRALSFDLSALGVASNCVVTLAPASGAVSFRRAKFAHGVFASAWSPRPRAVEIALCQRYFQVWRGGAAIVAPAAAQGLAHGALPVAMRATPTPSMSGNATITTPGIGSATVSAANLSSLTMLDAQTFAISFGSGSPATAAGQTGFLHAATLRFDAEF